MISCVKRAFEHANTISCVNMPLDKGAMDFNTLKTSPEYTRAGVYGKCMS